MSLNSVLGYDPHDRVVLFVRYGRPPGCYLVTDVLLSQWFKSHELDLVTAVDPTPYGASVRTASGCLLRWAHPAVLALVADNQPNTLCRNILETE